MAVKEPFRVARVYDDRSPGYRVLVDRLWPRGIKKQDAGLDEWLKDVAPSTELRRWYGHEPDKFHEFARRYRSELKRAPATSGVSHLRDVASRRRVTLLTATKDVERSAAFVLRDYLRGRQRDAE